ncbi:MAG TPA: ABC transporter permease [Pyrinomonadaceae bacterium]|nr:ABC transporter permease [Pyrinomonadaceae bacterium]
MNTLRQDLRYGFRRLIHKPGFTLVVILILALGIAANTAIFSVVNSVLLAPLPYEDPDRLVVVKEQNPAKTVERNSVSPGNFLDLQQERLFDSVTAFYETATTLQGQQDTEQLATAQVSVEFFQTLGVKPALGQPFSSEINGAAFEVGRFLSGDRLVVISDGLWKRRYASDPLIIGKKITLNSSDWEVVGVMPAGFSIPSKETDVWLPWDIARTYNAQRFPQGPPRDWRFLNTIGRIKDDTSTEETERRLSLFFGGLSEKFPETNRGWTAGITPLHEEVVSSSRLILLVLSGAVGMVLLLACANVAGLVLAQSTTRKREFALRLALGASRARVVRQQLTESFMLALTSGVIGVVLAWVGLDLLLSLAPVDTPRINEVAIDARALLFALAISITTAVVFGLLPALKSSKAELFTTLKDAGTRGLTGRLSNHRLRNAVVIAEVSLALVLVTCAGLFVRSFVQLISIDPGFNSENLLTMHITLDGATYGRRAGEYYKQVIERLESLPSVTSAAAVSTLPMSDVGVDFTRPYWREGDAEPVGDGEKVAVRMATPGYFKTMGISLLQGRSFTEQDRRDTGAVIMVSKSMADKVWPNENPVGKRLMLDYNRGKYGYEVVGVTSGIRYYGLKAEPRPEVFIPHAQNAYLPMNLVVRTASDPNRLAESIKAQVREVDPTQAVSNVRTMETLVSRSVATDRFSMWLLGLLASLALALATTGLFSLLSYFVSQRTHEIGVRMALGARQHDIFRLVLGQGALLLAAGLAIGLGVSFICVRLFSSLLFEISPTDPLTFMVTPALLSLAALLACYIPARRATKVDPLVALRAD